MVRCLLPVYESSTEFLLYIQSSFWYSSQHPVAFLVPFLLLNPNRSFLSTSSFFPSIQLLNIITAVFAVCATRLIVRWSLHIVALGFFFMAISVTPVKSSGYYHPDGRYEHYVDVTKRTITANIWNYFDKGISPDCGNKIVWPLCILVQIFKINIHAETSLGSVTSVMPLRMM